MKNLIQISREESRREMLASLLKEKGKICISIIIPTHRLSPERRTDRENAEKAVQRAKEFLTSGYADKEIKPLIKAIDELYLKIDFTHNQDGIGLFVSPGIQQLVQFSFPVKEKVIIGESFEIRDLLYEARYNISYFTLLLSEKGAALFEGKLDILHEIKDDHFPKKYEDEYEYNPPSRGSSYIGNAFIKDFERDKSQMEGIRYTDFLRGIDDNLNNYLINNIPLVVAGAKKELSYFEKITSHDKNVKGLIPGNYTHTPLAEFGELTWKPIKLFLDNATAELIREFEEKIGEGYGITGIHEIWKAANEGRGFKLLVEKDFSFPGFIKTKDDGNLYLHPPKASHRVLPDAVNDLISIVLEKNGHVILTENDALKNHQRIALITRY